MNINDLNIAFEASEQGLHCIRLFEPDETKWLAALRTVSEFFEENDLIPDTEFDIATNMIRYYTFEPTNNPAAVALLKLRFRECNRPEFEDLIGVQKFVGATGQPAKLKNY